MPVRRTLFVLAAAALVMVALAIPASAHVTVSPRSATSGGYATLTFQVPNEEDDATTTKVEVQFPRDTPIAEASVKPVPGWTVTVTKKALTTPVTTDDGGTITESVDTITWSADDGKGVGVGEFQQFLTSVHLPEATSVTFPTLQTYSNGTVVEWIAVTTANGPEPDHPAPVVTLAPATETDASASAPAPTSDDDSDNAKVIAVVALVFGAIGIVLGAAAFATRKKADTAA